MKAMQAAQHIHEHAEQNMRTILALGPRSVGLTEMSAGPNDTASLDIAREILGPAGYTICTADDGGDHCHEVPVAFRAGRLYVIDQTTVTELSPNLPGDGLGNDRHLTIVRFHNRLTGRKGAHAHTHWNAGLQGPHGNMLDNDRVKAAEVGSERMEHALQELLFGEGRDVQVTGDFNWRLHDNDKGFHVWTHSPKAMFDRLGLTYVTSGLDWMAWSKGIKRVGTTQVIPPGHEGNGSDHPWIVARLRRRLLRGST